MILEVIRAKQFDRDVKMLIRRGKDFDKFKQVLDILEMGESLPVRFKNHKLKGNFAGLWECHIEPDWLLIYSLSQDSIRLQRTGTHSDLFK